jgi:hypothetical protein
MALRFRRSVKLLPGVRLNISKRGAGLSVGPRGAKLSVNSRGQVRKTVGLPGTGLSWTEQSKLSTGARADEMAHDELGEIVAAVPPEDFRRQKRRALRKTLALAFGAVFVILVLAGAGSAAGAMLIPAVAVTLLAPVIAHR